MNSRLPSILSEEIEGLWVEAPSPRNAAEGGRDREGLLAAGVALIVSLSLMRVAAVGGVWCGWEVFDWFGLDMFESSECAGRFGQVLEEW